MTTTTPHLLRLPTELRYAIYDHLCPSTPHSYPYTQPSPIAAIDTTGPPLSLLLCTHALYAELSDYYFSRCTFRFVAQSFSHAANSPREKLSMGSLHVIRSMRRVELLLLPGTMQAALSAPHASLEVRGMSASWLSGQTGLLREEAGRVETVVVSMRRVSWNHAWCMREALLRPLEDLRGRVEFRAGEVMGPADVEEEMLAELRFALESLNG